MRRGVALLALGAMVVGGSVGGAEVAEARVYAGELSSLTEQGGEISSQNLAMAPGERTEVTLAFLNRSDFTWMNDGAGYISLYTHGPKYRRSVFDPGTWLGPTQVGRIREASVAPGGQATVKLALHAPEVEGVYEERFWLASEDRAWIDGAEVILTVTVSKEEDAGVVAKTEVAQHQSSQKEGSIVYSSVNRLSLVSGKTSAFKVLVQNNGDAWERVELLTDSSLFKTSEWDGATVGRVDGRVQSGGTAIIPVTVRAPQYSGDHALVLHLAIDGQRVEEVFTIPIVVTGGSETLESMNSEDYAIELSPAVGTVTEALIDEPSIRVGLLTIDDETQNKVIIMPEGGALEVRSESGDILATVSKGKEVSAYYANSRYYFNAGDGLRESAEPLQFVPETESDVLKVVNFDRKATRGARFSDNQFRGTLELRYNGTKKRVWLINELPIETYLKGLAETSHGSPMEYQKTMITAGRSFAYYYLTHPNTARTQEGFHVSAYSTDQVYLGYGWEARNTDQSLAVEETEGEIVEYQGTVAITPYFARSNGYTKDWSSVWWGDRAYAKGVAVPCDAGKSQYGHGVGIAQSGAICLANEGKTRDDILHHFFTGIDIVRHW